MKSRIKFCFLDGSQARLYADGVDLDYYTIRQWRKMWLDFYHLQTELNQDLRLIIEPSIFRPF